MPTGRMIKMLQKELGQQLYDKFEFMRSAEGFCIPCHVKEGWYNLILGFCGELKTYCIANKIATTSIKITGIKEKYGTLRINYNNVEDKACDDYLFNLTLKYEDLSTKICDMCGSTEGELKEKRGYYQTICPDCLIKREAEINAKR